MAFQIEREREKERERERERIAHLIPEMKKKKATTVATMEAEYN